MNETHTGEPQNDRIAPTARSRRTQKARAAAHKSLTAQANVRAARLLPIIEELKAAGITSTRGIATALDERGIATARAYGPWSPAQVRQLIKRLHRTVG
jgi:hypothetical protein